MTKLFDTHAHYTDESLYGNEGLIESIFAGDVGYILTAAVNFEDSVKCSKLAEKYENMYASAGIHPEEAGKISDIFSEVSKIENALSLPKIVALGEIGLDYHYGKEYAEEQKRLFDMQLSLAANAGLPVIVHDREAHADVFDIIKKYEGRVVGVMHSYSGHAEMAREYVKMGWYISFSGVITFKNAGKTAESASSVPLDRILVETDCPYLSPVPMRGKQNNSSYLHYTAERTADILGISYEEFAACSTNNAKRLFLKEN